MSTLYVNTISPNSGDTVTISGSLNTTGKFTVGDASSDDIIFNAQVSSSIVPDADDTYNLGSSTNEWKDLYVDGTGNIDTISSSNATIGTQLNAISASITKVSQDLLPSADGTYDLGSSTNEWQHLYIDGTANVDALDATHVTASFISALGIGGYEQIISGSNLISGSITSTGSFALVTAADGINGTLNTAAQTNVTSVGTLTGVTVAAQTTTAVGNIIVSGTFDINNNTLATVDAAHCGSATGSKFTVQNQLQAAITGGMASAQFTVGNPDINADSIILGNLIGSLNGTLSQSALNIQVTNNSASFNFLTPHSSSLGFGNAALAADNQAFTASFVVL